MTEEATRSRPAVGQRLVITRKALGYSQKEFAVKAGISPSSMAHYERGESYPSLPAAFSLCDNYGLTLDWIYFGDASNLRHGLARAIDAISTAHEQRLEP